MTTPTVSYLIAVYNHKEFITKTLESIRKECQENDEILITDDGSSDNSKAEVLHWIQSNPRLNTRFHHQNNKGSAQTWNDLIQQAKGVFLRPVAGDDMVVQGSTQLLIRILEASPELAAVFTDGFVIDAQDQPVAASSIAYSRGDIVLYETDSTKALISNWAIAGSCILWRKSTLTKNFTGYRTELCIEDWYMYLKLAAAKSLVFVNLKSCYYRVHSSNTSRTRDRKSRIKNLTSMIKTIAYCKDDFAPEHRAPLCKQTFLYSTKIMYLERSYVRAFWQFLKYLFA